MTEVVQGERRHGAVVASVVAPERAEPRQRRAARSRAHTCRARSATSRRSLRPTINERHDPEEPQPETKEHASESRSGVGGAGLARGHMCGSEPLTPSRATPSGGLRRLWQYASIDSAAGVYGDGAEHWEGGTPSPGFPGGGARPLGSAPDIPPPGSRPSQDSVL